jgi:hypothetical protein
MTPFEQHVETILTLYSGMAANILTAEQIERYQEDLADLWAELDEAEQLHVRHLISSYNAMGPGWLSDGPRSPQQDGGQESDEETSIVAFHGPCGPGRCGVRLPIFRTGNRLWVHDPWGESGPVSYPASQVESFAREGTAILASQEQALPRGVTTASAVVLCAGRLLAELSSADPNPLPRRPDRDGRVFYSIEARPKARKRLFRWSSFLVREAKIEAARPRRDLNRMDLLDRGYRDCASGGAPGTPPIEEVVRSAQKAPSGQRRPAAASWQLEVAA